MGLQQNDTIAAISTGVQGSIAIIRLSGPHAISSCQKIWAGTPLAELPPRTMTLGRIVNRSGTAEDHCLAVSMPAPNSYTGEDVVELHCHGGTMVARTVLGALLQAGARHAEPGEFTRRAFINGKLDLTQAEAVLDIIQAQSQMALHAANRQLDGLLGRRIDAAYDTVTRILAETEVRLDFVEEDLDWEASASIRRRLEEVRADLLELLAHRHEGEVLHHGIRLVIAGAPNAGKSSLLNRLLGRDRAIVTEIPGTTRDTLEEHATVRGIPIHLVDTAGIRASADTVERLGVARSYASIEQAQIVLWLIDVTGDIVAQAPPRERLAGKGLLIVANKIDLLPDAVIPGVEAATVIRLSALTGQGFTDLLDRIEAEVWGHPHYREPEIAINARHCQHLEAACEHLDQALGIVEAEMFELLAVNLRSTLGALGHITGKTLQPDILDTIFGKFCIGK